MINRILALLAISTVASYGAANDLLIAQRNSTDTGQLTRLVAHPGGGQNGLVVYNGTTLLPQIILVGDGLVWSSGTLSALATQAVLDAKQDTITTATSADYYRGDKTWQSLNKSAVGLSNVDNTSDSAKPISTATQTALDAKAATSSISTAGYSGSYLDLSNKPTLGTAASANSSSFATAAQGTKADSAVQPSGSSGQYIAGNGSFVTFPSVPAAQVSSDWNSVSGVSQILNKPSLGTAASQNSTAFATAAQGAAADSALQPSGNGSSLTGLTKTQVGLFNVENTALSTWAGSTNITTLGTVATGTWQGTAIANAYIASASTWNAKFNTPSGSTSQYVRGDGSLATFPTIPASQVNSDWNSGSGVSQILNKPTLATVAVSGSYTDLSNTPSAPAITNNPSRTIQTVAAAANGWQVSSTKTAFVSYSVTITVNASGLLAGAGSGYVVLETATTNSASAGAWAEIARASNGQQITSLLTLASVQPVGSTLAAYIAPGNYLRLRSVNTQGTPSYAINSCQEVVIS